MRLVERVWDMQVNWRKRVARLVEEEKGGTEEPMIVGANNTDGMEAYMT